jgi:hypothetical protein
MYQNSTEFLMENQEVINKAFEPSLTYKVGNFTITPSYFQAVAILLMVFLILFSIARLRRMEIGWSLKGGISLMAIGFALAIVVEGFLLIGGKSVLIEVFAWKNPPKPIAKALEAGRVQLITVLGAKDENSSQSVLENFNNLPEGEQSAIKSTICK